MVAPSPSTVLQLTLLSNKITTSRLTKQSRLHSIRRLDAMPSDSYCRFPACRQSGLYFKRLDKHLKQCHPGKTNEDSFKTPFQNPMDRRLVVTTDRHRQPCTVFGCRCYNVPISRLDRHARKIHGTKPQSKENKDSAVDCSFSEEEETVLLVLLSATLNSIVPRRYFLSFTGFRSSSALLSKFCYLFLSLLMAWLLFI